MIIVFYLHPLIKGNFSSVCLGLLEENIFVLEKPGNINTTITKLLTCSKQAEIAVLVVTLIPVQQLSKNKATTRKHIGDATK